MLIRMLFSDIEANYIDDMLIPFDKLEYELQINLKNAKISNKG